MGSHDYDVVAQGDRAEGGDAVDAIRREWELRRPDLELDAISVVGRVLRSAALIIRRSDEVLAEYGLGRGEFDILAALRRSEGPQSPGSLRTISLASAPATTKRLKSLEGRELVVRRANPADGRGALISLTAKGELLVDEIFPIQLAAEKGLLSALASDERAEVVRSLTLLLASIERPSSRAPR